MDVSELWQYVASPPGAMEGGATLNAVAAAVTNDILARAIVFGVVILIIIVKPAGLFSFKGR